MAHSMASEYLFPFLAVNLAVLYCCRLAGLERLLQKTFVPAVFFGSALLCFPLFGSLSLSEYLLSLSPSYSAAIIFLTMVVLYEQIRKVKILSRKDLLVFSVWNVVISAVLYASFLGFIDADLYRQGYGFSAWFALLAIPAAILALLGSPVSGILIACLAAYDIRLLHSANIWDYMTDGVMFLFSLGILFAYAVKSMFQGRSAYDR